jgi:hypothetical protein
MERTGYEFYTGGCHAWKETTYECGCVRREWSRVSGDKPLPKNITFKCLFGTCGHKKDKKD